MIEKDTSRSSTTHPANNILITEVREHIDAASKYLTEGSTSWILPAFLSTRGLEKLAVWVKTSKMPRTFIHMPLAGYSMHVWKVSRQCRNLARLSYVAGPRSISAHTTVYAVALAPVRARHWGRGLSLASPGD
ncbi:unnamed protein product [Cyclocybe aegerita]|uniref:Uncharacterized protein n=1 Tax=Cyclocybe aegerita TaxID=1973307 RepID=A0A8S0W2Q5_CYCAE|nr:unnamed protein product [Cyclocybe aegerita]